MRPSIANKVFIGNFKLKKDVRVFDITALTEEYPKQSGNEFSKFEFISELDKQMSKPISVHEAKRDYIPTQVITEYIREYFDCDGIIYSSSLYKKEGKNCSNIVLFDDSPEFSESEVLEYIDYEIVEIEDIEYKKKLNITN